MLFNGFDVLLKSFTINPTINSARFVGSNGRTSHRVRSNNPINWESKITLDFQDNDKTLEFTESLKPLQSYEIEFGAGDVEFIAPEMDKAGGVTKVFLTKQPRVSANGYKSSQISLSLILDKSNVTAPSVIDNQILWSIAWEWKFTTDMLRDSEFHESYSGNQSTTGDLVTGRSAKFSYFLTYKEYIELLKYILWGVRYDEFLWDGEIAVFEKLSFVKITNFSFKYAGKLMYNVDLVIESA